MILMDNNKTYLIVIGHYGAIGGAERQALHFIKYLRKINANVAVLGWYDGGPLAQTLRELGCKIYNFPYKEHAQKISKGLNLLQLAFFIRRQIRPDYILPFVSIHSKPICQIWRLTGARYVWWNQQDEGRGLFGSQAERKALLNACHVTSNSLAGTQFLSETYGIPEEKIITYNNGTVLPDLASIKPIWREQLGVPSEGKLVSMVANITPFKDHETLLRAWRIVLDRFSTVSLTLALAGHLNNKDHVQKLKAMAFDLGLGPNVKFIGSTDSTDELMFESDLVVHSSVKEGCPNAVCEAMALGKSIVCTDIPGTRQALDKSLWDTCLCEPYDEHELAEKIIYFLENSAHALKIGLSNRKRIEKEFSIDGMCEFFDSLLNSSHR
jgi:glycosyltransferase involved in cell wall biosynthesis